MIRSTPYNVTDMPNSQVREWSRMDMHVRHVRDVPLPEGWWAGVKVLHRSCFTCMWTQLWYQDCSSSSNGMVCWSKELDQPHVFRLFCSLQIRQPTCGNGRREKWPRAFFNIQVTRSKICSRFLRQDSKKANNKWSKSPTQVWSVRHCVNEHGVLRSLSSSTL